MIKYKKSLFTNFLPLTCRSILAVVLCICGIGGCLQAGTHGALESYDFSCSKGNLQRRVDSLLSNDSTIVRSVVTDTFTSKYYNDGNRYLTFKIFSSADTNEYTIQYSGTNEMWDTATTSQIALVYAFDKKGQGGDAAQIDNNKVRSQLLSTFEEKFVYKLRMGANNSVKN
jgi:hypothetical protein